MSQDTGQEETRAPGNPGAPRRGQRVQFTCSDHPFVGPGLRGTISLAAGDRFWVAMDRGSFFGWTSFVDWELTGEPDALPCEIRISWH